VVVIEDFHVLDDRLRGSIADLLKLLADMESQRSKLIVVGINRAGDSLIDHAPDLVNRDTIRFEVEPDEKVRELVALGEAALNIEIEAKDKIVEGAQGSFYLAQPPRARALHRCGDHRGARRAHRDLHPL
jgi:hypothetical protein